MQSETPQITTIYQGPRGTAIKILNRVERTDAYLDKLLDSELRATDISDVDKSLLAEIVHGVIRWQGRLDWILNGFTHGNFIKSEINLKNALRVALYQILFLNHVPHYAAVNEAVEFVKNIRGTKLADFVNAVLRNIIRTLDGIHYPKEEEDLSQYLAVYYSHPQWMVKRWLQRFDRAEVEKLLVANNEVPTLTLRINKLKTDPAQFLSLLDQQHITYQGSSLIDYFLKVKSLSAISHLNIFQKGLFSIQDESAALPILLLDPQPGETIIDLCAAPGGKTTFLAERMNNTGVIYAVDKYESKLNLIQTSCTRLGITNVRITAADALELSLPPVQKIILDVPCSGLGVLRKKPDIKWKREQEDIPRLAALQMKLLERSAQLLQPGGVIVYCTCTTEPEENSHVVRAFLSLHPEFRLEHADKFVNHAVVSEEGFIETYTHRQHIDGSFAARLRKSDSYQKENP